jgi:hypothetical protein
VRKDGKKRIIEISNLENDDDDDDRKSMNKYIIGSNSRGNSPNK